MKKQYLSPAWLVAAVFLVAMPRFAAAAERYTPIDTEELIHSPQRYWAQAILFRDILLTPAKGSQLNLENRRYTAFSVKKLGTCYASQDLVPLLDELPLNREYAFSGSVFQYRGRFYIVAQGATPVASTEAMYRELRATAGDEDMKVDEDAMKPIADILWKVQAEHLAYAKEHKIPLCQLYDPTSEHYARALDITRSAIMDEEQKSKTVSAEILANYIATSLAKSCPPAVPAAAPAKKSKPKLAPIELRKKEPEEAVPEPVVTAPPPPAPEPRPEPEQVPEEIIAPPPAATPDVSSDQVSKEEERARYRQKKAALKAEEDRLLQEQQSAERAKRIEASLLDAELDFQKALEREQALPPPEEKPARKAPISDTDTALPLYRN